MQITFRKSLLAAFLSGTVAVITPVLAGSLVMAQTGTGISPAQRAAGANAAGAANVSNGTVNVGNPQNPASASEAAGANAAGAANTSSGTNDTINPATGTYGGYSNDTSGRMKGNVKNKTTAPPSATAPSSNMGESPQSTSQPHN